MVSDSQFVITSSNTTTFLQVSKQTFNHISFFVRDRIKRTSRPLFIRLIGNHRRNSTLPQTLPIVLRRTTFVAQHLLRTTTNTPRWCTNFYLIHRRKNKRIIARLTRTNQRRQRMNIVVAHRDNFRRQTAARPANSVVCWLACYFFFVSAPAADLCALTIVPSTENCDQSILPSASKHINNLSRIKSQVPSNCQRR